MKQKQLETFGSLRDGRLMCKKAKADYDANTEGARYKLQSATARDDIGVPIYKYKVPNRESWF